MRITLTAAAFATLLAVSAAETQEPATADPAASAFLHGDGSLLDIAMKNVEGADRPDDPAWRDGQCGPCILDTLDRQTDPTLDTVVAECAEQSPPALRRRQHTCAICGAPGKAATMGVPEKPQRRRKRTPQEPPTPVSSAPQPESAPSGGDDANAVVRRSASGGKTPGGFERNTCKNPNEVAMKLSETWDDRVPETEELRAKFEKVFGMILEEEKGKKGTPA
ncbi:hypothetical protein BDZ85DRAFT_264705 [Elsinoe ampelina]|uniref:Uncharacterized protein n=1 Tax=Elsinoe ampelina TaxID=302913 RepID=A0A6A6G8J4_9PEZI|nr:hypothetical protein BDZ85DRAFT_264705 [Elsinoe ampelina]